MVIAIAALLAFAFVGKVESPESSVKLPNSDRAARGRPPAPTKNGARFELGPPAGESEEDGLARCAFERAALRGQLARCAGVPLSWEDSVDPIEDRDEVERGIREHLAGTPIELVAVECSEYPCVIRMEVPLYDRESLDRAMAWIEEGESGYAPGYTRFTTGDRVVETRALMAEWPTHEQRARLQYRRKQLGQKGFGAAAEAEATSPVSDLERCQDEVAQTRRELGECDGAAVEWEAAMPDVDPDSARLHFSDVLLAELTPDDEWLEAVDCQEYPCIAVVGGAQTDRAPQLGAAALGRLDPDGFTAANVGETPYLLLVLPNGPQSASNKARVRVRQQEILRMLIDAR